MQTQAFRHAGLNAVYLAFRIEKKDLPGLLEAFDLLNIRGFNVTVPHKENILPFLTEISKPADILQSVNTVIRTPSGWKGYSTDGEGFIRSLNENGVSVKDKNVLLIGAGGAARAIAVSLAEHGVSSLSVKNRTPERADRLAKLVNAFYPDLPVDCNPENPIPGTIIVNCTSAGMTEGECPVVEDDISGAQLVVDIIYNPPETSLMKMAEIMKIPVMNGIGMLLYQGVEAFEIWTGKAAPIEVMRKSLKKSLAFI